MKIGVIGGGQLGRMLALAGTPLGMNFAFLDPAPDACAAALGEHLRADYSDPDHLRQLADEVDLVTFEFESVPAETVAFLSQFVPVYPSAEALRIARDRWFEKSMFKDLGIPTPAFADIQSQADLDAAVASIGLPAVLKTRTLGYDGKGQKVLRTPEDVVGTFAELGNVACLLEGFVPFTGEVSLIAVRARDGETRFYPLVHNTHDSGILKLSTFDRAFWIMVVCVTVMFLFVRSRFGRTVQAIREDYIAASASGINVTYYKVLTFAVSAFFAGVGGSVYAHYMTAMIPTNFNFNYSAELLSEVIIGGTGSLTGSIIGAAFLSSLPELMRDFSTYRMLIYAIVMITMMLFNWAPAARDFRSRIIEKIKGHVKEKEAA